MSLSIIERNILIAFIKKCLVNFDSSHDYEHAKEVFELSKKIAKEENVEVEENIFEIAALTHDVCDHKYKDKGGLELSELKSFLTILIGEKDSNRVVEIVDNVSFSKQKKLRLENKEVILPEPDNTYLKIIRDADRIASLGMRGIQRTNDFAKAFGLECKKEIKEHNIRLCKERALIMVSDGYIVTKTAIELALPLLEENINWLNEAEEV